MNQWLTVELTPTYILSRFTYDWVLLFDYHTMKFFVLKYLDVDTTFIQSRLKKVRYLMYTATSICFKLILKLGQFSCFKIHKTWRNERTQKWKYSKGFCIYIYIYTCIYTYRNTCMHTYINTYTYTKLKNYLPTYLPTYTHIPT